MYLVLEPVLLADDPGQAFSTASVLQHYRHSGNGFDAGSYTPHPVTKFRPTAQA